MNFSSFKAFEGLFFFLVPLRPLLMSLPMTKKILFLELPVSFVSNM